MQTVLFINSIYKAMNQAWLQIKILKATSVLLFFLKVNDFFLMVYYLFVFLFNRKSER